MELTLTNINNKYITTKRKIFNEEEINQLINRLNNKTLDFYNYKEIWNAICRVERGKVSNRLRFYIYNRDNYKCQNCGRKNKI